jgi:hypothetical protein
MEAAIRALEENPALKPAEAFAPIATEPPTEPPTETPSPEPSSSRAERRKASRKEKKEKRRDGVKTMIEVLSESGDWGWTAQQLQVRLKIPRATLDRDLESPEVNPTWVRYQDESRGKGPASKDDV